MTYMLYIKIVQHFKRNTLGNTQREFWKKFTYKIWIT